MTVRELNRLRSLPAEIEAYELRLEEMIKDATSAPSPKLSGMPMGSDVGSPTERSGINDVENR